MIDGWTRAEELQLFGILGTIVVGLLAVWAVKIGKANHVLINSRLTQLLDAITTGARAEGAAQERAAADARNAATDERNQPHSRQ